MTTDMSIADISFECGFSDPKYFYSAFKELWHLTPTKDRERYKAQYEEAQRDTSSVNYSLNEASSFIKDYITYWHIEKTIRHI